MKQEAVMVVHDVIINKYNLKRKSIKSYVANVDISEFNGLSIKEACSLLKNVSGNEATKYSQLLIETTQQDTYDGGYWSLDLVGYREQSDEEFQRYIEDANSELDECQQQIEILTNELNEVQQSLGKLKHVKDICKQDYRSLEDKQSQLKGRISSARRRFQLALNYYRDEDDEDYYNDADYYGD